MSRQVTSHSKSITSKPLGVATPNNHSPKVNKAFHHSTVCNNISPTYLINAPSQDQLPSTSASTKTIRENTRICEIYSEEESSESSYVPTDSGDTSTSSDEDYEQKNKRDRKQKGIGSKCLSKRFKENSQRECSQETKGKHVITKKAVPRSTSKLSISEDSESVSNDHEEYQNIILTTAKQDGHRRIYDKRHVCCFCNKPYIKMARHLETCHSNENEVAKLIAQPKKSSERRNGFIKIMRTGDFQHNIEVLSSHVGELILVRRPSEESTTYEDYGPCPHCLGFMMKKHIWLHIKQCEEHTAREQSVKKNVMTDSNSLLMSILRPSIDKNFRDNILSGMMNDSVSFVCKNDDLIVRFGALQYEKYCDTQKDLIRQSMRQLGRLLIKLRQFDTESRINSLANFITPQYFDVIIESVKTLCREKSHSTSRPQYDIPSLALKLGHHLRKCVGILRGLAIRQGCSSKDENLKNFLQLLDLEWSIRISSNALSTLYIRKMNVVELLPLTSDLLKLNKYISEQIDSRMRELTNTPDKNKWHNLAKITLARIVLFNKRRGGEVSKMLKINYNSNPDWSSSNSQELMGSLTDVEKELARKFKLIEIMGKRGKKVPVLLTEEMFLAVSKLMETRNSVGIPSQNEYVFARPSGGSLGHIRAPDCLRWVVDEVPLEAPELIRSTKLRKYIATVTQVLNLKENEADWLAKHLGHDIRVHRSFYRLHESAVELTKISRLLMAVDEGKVKTFAGQALENITLNGKYFYDTNINTHLCGSLHGYQTFCDMHAFQ